MGVKKNSEVLALEIDRNKIDEIDKRVQTNSDIINGIVAEIVNKYCKPLDDYMAEIDKVLISGGATPLELDEFTLNLPVLLYFVSDAQESLGVKEDISRAVKQELYNTVRDESSGTVADKDSVAELATQYETIVNIIYSRAYKKFKARVEAGYEMLASVKKVITRRTVEMELTKLAPDRIREVK